MDKYAEEDLRSMYESHFHPWNKPHIEATPATNAAIFYPIVWSLCKLGVIELMIGGTGLRSKVTVNHFFNHGS